MKLYEHTNVMITTKLDFKEWSSVFGDAKISCLFGAMIVASGSTRLSASMI